MAKKIKNIIFVLFGLVLFFSTSKNVSAAVINTVATTTPIGAGVNLITNRIYVANYNINTVTVIDGTTDTIVTTIPVGSRPGSVVVNPNTNRVYVTNNASANVTVIDGTTDTVLTTVAVGTNPGGVDINLTTNLIYVVNNQSDSISVLDGVTNTVVATIPVGLRPGYVAVNPTTNRIYVTNNGDNTMSVIDGTTNSVINTMPVGNVPYGVVLNPTTNRIYVAMSSDNNVWVIDGATDTLLTTIPVGSLPIGMGINPATNHVFVTNLLSDSVSVIDEGTDTVIDTVSVDSQPYWAAVNSVTNHVYVPNYAGNTVSVLDDVPSSQQLTSLNPAQVWVGLKNSDDVGVKFDLKAEVYKNTTLIGSGELTSVHAGSSGFNNANLNSIPLTLNASVSVQSSDVLKIAVYVRNACVGSGHNSGTARLWFNDSAANSQFGAVIDSNTNDYFLLDGFLLGTSVGPGPKKKIDVAAGAKCSPYKTFGTWSIAL